MRAPDLLLTALCLLPVAAGLALSLGAWPRRASATPLPRRDWYARMAGRIGRG